VEKAASLLVVRTHIHSLILQSVFLKLFSASFLLLGYVKLSA